MTTDLTPAERAQWREEAELGVCNDLRREFGRDYRILDLLDALDAAEAERDTLREQVAAVRELADEWDEPDPAWRRYAGERLRAALAGEAGR